MVAESFDEETMSSDRSVRRMKRTLAVRLVVMFLLLGLGWSVGAAVQQQTPQKTATSAEMERRDQSVTDDDLRILLKAEELLKDESVWNRKDDRECTDDEATGKRSLFCALQKASSTSWERTIIDVSRCRRSDSQWRMRRGVKSSSIGSEISITCPPRSLLTSRGFCGWQWTG